jgi:hypothetical protein
MDGIVLWNRTVQLVCSYPLCPSSYING